MAAYQIKNVGEVSTSAGKVQNYVSALTDNAASINFILNEVGQAWSDSSLDAQSALKALNAHVSQLQNICEACSAFANGMNQFGHALDETSSQSI